jgi:hypothetical protein
LVRRAAGRRRATEGESVLDSPFDFCKVCREYVLLDQTQRQCAAEHGCGHRPDCPLARYFTGIEFGKARKPPVKRRRA